MVVIVARPRLRTSFHFAIGRTAVSFFGIEWRRKIRDKATAFALALGRAKTDAMTSLVGLPHPTRWFVEGLTTDFASKHNHQYTRVGG